MYSGIFLDNKSKSILSTKIDVPNGWKQFGDHMTIKMGGLPVDLQPLKGKEFTLTIVGIGVSETNIAFRVKSKLSTNKIPHITWAVDMNNAKPFDSNKITKWNTISPFEVKGILSEK